MFREFNRAVGNLTVFQTSTLLLIVVAYVVGIVYLGTDFDGFCKFLRKW